MDKEKTPHSVQAHYKTYTKEKPLFGKSGLYGKFYIQSHECASKGETSDSGVYSKHRKAFDNSGNWIGGCETWRLNSLSNETIEVISELKASLEDLNLPEYDFQAVQQWRCICATIRNNMKNRKSVLDNDNYKKFMSRRHEYTKRLSARLRRSMW